MPDLNRGPLGLTPDELTTRLAPHMARFRLSEIFLDMDVAWEGEDARDFHLLLRSMAEWIDVHATLRVARLRTRIDILNGDPPGDHEAKARQVGREDFRSILKPILEILEGGSTPGYKARFKDAGAGALRALTREIRDSCVTRIPELIAELEAEIRSLKARSLLRPRQISA